MHLWWLVPKPATWALPRKIVEARYNFDRTRLTVSFGAEGRVDFRLFVRELGSALPCRVELRQVGDRDMAKRGRGTGRCGRTHCRVAWMGRFESISIRMAKEPALPISAMVWLAPVAACVAAYGSNTSNTGG